MQAAKPGAYLVIARYDHKRWKLLSREERQAAHQAAEDMFPYEPPVNLPHPDGVRFVQTFHSGFHTRILSSYSDNSMEERSDEEWRERDLLVGQILNSLPRKIADTEINGPDTEVDEPGVGWFAIVDADSLSSFVAQMGGEAGPLWNMYDIEVIPVNDAQTTQDIYQLMTPVHWN